MILPIRGSVQQMESPRVMDFPAHAEMPSATWSDTVTSICIHLHVHLSMQPLPVAGSVLVFWAIDSSMGGTLYRSRLFQIECLRKVLQSMQQAVRGCNVRPSVWRNSPYVDEKSPLSSDQRCGGGL
jgi:hypothetical protein